MEWIKKHFGGITGSTAFVAAVLTILGYFGLGPGPLKEFLLDYWQWFSVLAVATFIGYIVQIVTSAVIDYLILRKRVERLEDAVSRIGEDLNESIETVSSTNSDAWKAHNEVIMRLAELESVDPPQSVPKLSNMAESLLRKLTEVKSLKEKEMLADLSEGEFNTGMAAIVDLKDAELVTYGIGNGFIRYYAADLGRKYIRDLDKNC